MSGRRSAVALLVALAVSLSVAACGGGSHHVRRAATRPSARSCPVRVTLHVQTRVTAGRGVGPLAVAGSSLYAARPAAGEVIRLRPSPRVARRVGGDPVSLAIAFHKLWVAQRDANRVSTLSPRSLAADGHAGVEVPVSLAASGPAMWALSLDQNALVEIVPGSDGVAQQISSPQVPAVQMVAVGHELWVLGAGLSPFNARLDRVTRIGFAVTGRALGGLSASGSTIWFAEPGRHALVRSQVSGPVRVSELPAPRRMAPTTTAATPCGVWIADAQGELALVSQSTGAPLAPSLRIGRSAAALVASGNGVWVSDPIDGAVVRVVAEPAGR